MKLLWRSSFLLIYGENQEKRIKKKHFIHFHYHALPTVFIETLKIRSLHHIQLDDSKGAASPTLLHQPPYLVICS